MQSVQRARSSHCSARAHRAFLRAASATGRSTRAWLVRSPDPAAGRTNVVTYSTCDMPCVRSRAERTVNTLARARLGRRGERVLVFAQHFSYGSQRPLFYAVAAAFKAVLRPSDKQETLQMVQAGGAAGGTVCDLGAYCGGTTRPGSAQVSRTAAETLGLALGCGRRAGERMRWWLWNGSPHAEHSLFALVCASVCLCLCLSVCGPRRMLCGRGVRRVCGPAREQWHIRQQRQG